MVNSMVSQSAQAAVLSGTSNIIAQAIVSYTDKTPFTLNYNQIFIFALFSILSTPPNCIWQSFLERTFPGDTAVPVEPTKEKPAPPTEKKLNVANTAKKFALDQTFGAAMNTWMYIAYMAVVKHGANFELIWHTLQHESWGLYLAGARLWPAVSLISFIFVPVDQRVVFASVANMFWNIYLSMLAN